MNGIYTDTGGGVDIPLEKCGVQLLKTTHAEKTYVHITNSESCNIQLGS